MEVVTSSMSFTLKDGNTVNISKEDIKDISNKIMLECVLQFGSGNIIIETSTSTNLERVNCIREILKETKDLDESTKQMYHKEMLSLLSTEGEIIKNRTPAKQIKI